MDDLQAGQRNSRPNLHIDMPQKPAVSPTRSLDANGKRRSIFTEVGLDDSTDESSPDTQKQDDRPRRRVRFRSKPEIHEAAEDDAEEEESPIIVQTPTSPPRGVAWTRMFFFTFLLAFLLPALHTMTSLQSNVAPLGATAGPIPEPRSPLRETDAQLVRRDDTETDVCKRWSQQSALVNGTLYLYGGRTMTSSSQTSGTWNNDFLYVDLTTDWDISAPSLTALATPSGPPAVANGFLWNSYTQLFLYGGEYSDTPVTSPSAVAIWSYDIPSSSWSSYATPSTVAGANSDGGGIAVQGAAEGAGLNIAEIGRGYYFGGHLDGYTTEGWSQWIDRVYLKTLLEFTFPGYSNSELSDTAAAGSNGEFRNITSGLDSSGFTERADGILVYVPGYGDDGIILGLAGGTNASFTQMNVIDVFDIATSTWYKQSTSGTTPEYRVNPCAVAVSAADGSSTNVYMYGGQNLVPAGEQTQYNDTWILTIPSFTWIAVDTSDQSVPPGRSGHTCNVWNSQMVVVGGYVGTDLSCDSPGIYVFDTTNLTWTSQYTALESDNSDNPQNQQVSQQGDSSGLSGSYDYKVNGLIQSVIGGNSEGGATVTSPKVTAESGPMATGSAKTYTLTGSLASETATASATVTSKITSTASNGAVTTSTETSTVPTSTGSDNGSNGGVNIAAIVASVVAAVFFLIACYLGWCVWMYKKHLELYKRHVSMAQRAQLGLDTQNKTGLLFPAASLDRTPGRTSDENSSTGVSGQRRGHGYQPVSGGSGGKTTNESSGFGTTDSSSGRRKADGDDSASISSTEELLGHGEPSFMGVVLNPRRTLRVVNN